MEYPVANYESEIQGAVVGADFSVFLCGPSMKHLSNKGGALRKIVKDELEKEGFCVVLGEDDGLMQLQKDFGGDAQSNEVGFFTKKANAIVLIADSPGSFAELGLFSHLHSGLDKRIIFILIAKTSYQTEECYISQGPIRIVSTFGNVFYADLDSSDFDGGQIIGNILRLLKTARFRSCI